MTVTDSQTAAGPYWRLAAGLYDILRTEPDNLIYSPYGIGTALAALCAGTAGATKDELASLLGVDVADRRGGAAFSIIRNALVGRSGAAPATWSGDPSCDQEGTDFHLTLATALWRQEGYACRRAYERLLESVFDASLFATDLSGDPDGSCRAINDFISDKTGGRINGLVSRSDIPRDDPSQPVRMIMACAVHLKSAWEKPFEREDTNRLAFNMLDGTQIHTPMMRQRGHFGYSETDDFQLVEVPYIRPEVGFVAVLPRHGRWDHVGGMIDSEFLEETLFAEERGIEFLELGLPRLDFARTLNLKETLEELGVRLIFREDADFSNISEEIGFRLGALKHHATLSVDEDGTEAAAATALVTVGAAPAGGPEPIKLLIDRPFLFFVIDHPTKTVLFAGHVTLPEAG